LQTYLGINTGFAINRFPMPEDWTSVVADLGLRYAQFTADLLNPFLPAAFIESEIETIRALCERREIQIHSVFTSAFTRVNHLLHPDNRVRDIWQTWLCKLFEMGAAMGAQAGGSHFGILSVSDNADPTRRRERIREGIRRWQEIAARMAPGGLRYLTFEPMSVFREVAPTITETRKLLDALRKDSRRPFHLCLDVDHGWAQSPDPRDADPYAWLEEFAADSPMIHIKQSSADKNSHWPFTREMNERGVIRPDKVLRALERGGARETFLFLELSHRERYPVEESVLEDFRESVAYWRKDVTE